MTAAAQPAHRPPPPIDWQALAAPIPGGHHPTGTDLRYDPVFDEIREHRREEDENLPQGVWQTEVKRADWSAVRGLCLDVLYARSKDLQVAVWLLEASIHIDGFAGARDGLKVLNVLCARFWDDLHPAIEDGDVEYRTAPLEWVNDKLSLALRMVPVTAPDVLDIPVFSWSDWDEARRLDNLSKKDAKAYQQELDSGKPTLDDFFTSARLTPPSHYHALRQVLDETLEEAGALSDLFDARMGRDSPSLGRFVKALGDVRALIATCLKETGDPMAEQKPEERTPSEEPGTGGSATAAEPAPSAAPPTPEPPGAAPSQGPITSREDAYRRLEEVADYLMRIEPHSPTPYLIRRAVSWGRMPLHELLPELMDENSNLGSLARLLGIKPSDRE